MVARERQITKACPVRGGYTLMEMLVVVAIIVVLAGIGGYYLLPKLDEAKEDADLAQTKELTKACEDYKIQNDTWPPSLDALTQPKPGGGAPYVSEEALYTKIKPGEKYLYDASGPNNKQRVPDISVATTHGTVIGNWMSKVQH
jgi:general secretion pathway protein G